MKLNINVIEISENNKCLLVLLLFFIVLFYKICIYYKLKIKLM